MVRGTLHGYFFELTKIVLVVSPRNVPHVGALFWRYRLHIVTGSRYLGGIVGAEAEQTRWLGENIKGC